MEKKEREAYRRQVEHHRSELNKLLKSCPHWFSELTEEELADEWMSVGAYCKICRERFGWRCKHSPDSTCHYFSATDRDGVPCVTLNDGTMDHIKFRQSIPGWEGYEWGPEDETYDSCLYCGHPEERK